MGAHSAKEGLALGSDWSGVHPSLHFRHPTTTTSTPASLPHSTTPFEQNRIMAPEKKSARGRRQQANRASKQAQQAKRNSNQVQQASPPPAVFATTLIILSTTRYLIVLVSQGRYPEALEMLPDVLPAASRTLDINSASVFAAVGTAFAHSRQYGMALEYFIRALAVLENVVGEVHPMTAEMTRNVALAYAALGQRQNAQLFHQRADARTQMYQQRVLDMLQQRSSGMGLYGQRQLTNGSAIGRDLGWWRGLFRRHLVLGLAFFVCLTVAVLVAKAY